MKSNVIKVLADVFKLISKDKSVLKEPQVITSKLKQKGIAEKEILNAMMWLVSFFNYDAKVYDNIPEHRILTPLEIERLGPGGYEFLNTLMRDGVMSVGRREFLIDRVMAVDIGKLELKTLKLLTFISLVNDKKHVQEIKWIESIVLKDNTEKATLLH